MTRFLPPRPFPRVSVVVTGRPFPLEPVAQVYRCFADAVIPLFAAGASAFEVGALARDFGRTGCGVLLTEAGRFTVRVAP